MADPAPDTPAAAPNEPLTLQVGERRFTTRAATLMSGSDYFASQLSDRWPSMTRTDDGSYFIDADGDVFAHVLRFLRHGTMPVLYDRTRGHDHALYVAVLEQARFFGVGALGAWLEGKRYLAAVKVVRSVKVLEDAVEEGGEMRWEEGAHVEVEHHVVWRKEKVYVCPRGLARHRGDPSACGKQCRNVRGDADDEYVDEDVVKVVEVRKETTVDPKMCVE